MDITPTGAPQGSAPAGSPAPMGSKPGSNKLLVIAIAAVVGLSVLGWVGKVIVGNMVGYGMKKAIEAGTGVKVDDKSGKVTYKGADGSTMEVTNTNSGTVTFKGADGKTVEINGGNDTKTLPKDFPSDFPIMDGATITSTYSMMSEGTGTFTVEWSTKKTVTEAHDFYVQALKDKGWHVSAETSSDNQYYISFDRGPADAQQKDGGWLTIAPGDNGDTKINVLVSINAKK